MHEKTKFKNFKYCIRSREKPTHSVKKYASVNNPNDKKKVLIFTYFLSLFTIQLFPKATFLYLITYLFVSSVLA